MSTNVVNTKMQPKISKKSWFGDFLGSVVSPALGLVGSALGGPVGGIVGGGIGSALSKPLSKLKKGGVVKKPARLVKGSKAAKAYMASIRKMKK